MIVADTNIWIAYFAGDRAPDIMQLDSSLASNTYAMVPMVQAELLSNPMLTTDQEQEILQARTLTLLPGYWLRLGKLRSSLISRDMRPKLVDSMIAQICMDHDALLLSRDAGFRRFVDTGLKLYIEKGPEPSPEPF